jgi:hypothetical protein
MTAFEHVRDRLGLASIRGMCVSDEERSRLDEELDELLLAIARCESFESAGDKLRSLGLMQELLATLSFRYRINLSEKQRQLVHVYDRWDDAGVLAASYEAIKAGRFP